MFGNVNLLKWLFYKINSIKFPLQKPLLFLILEKPEKRKRKRFQKKKKKEKPAREATRPAQLGRPSRLRPRGAQRAAAQPRARSPLSLWQAGATFVLRYRGSPPKAERGTARHRRGAPLPPAPCPYKASTAAPNPSPTSPLLPRAATPLLLLLCPSVPRRSPKQVTVDSSPWSSSVHAESTGR